jgi:glycopeptide antibiotics resistance protein
MAVRDPSLDSGLVEGPGRPASDDAGPAPADTSRTIEYVALAVYILVLVWIVLLKLHTDDFGDLVGRRSLNLVPFGGTASGGLGSSELAVNVLVFIPLGVLVYLAARERNLARVFLPIVGLSLTFEIVQYIFGIGASDITDIITNSAGGLIGIGIAWLGLRLLGDRGQRWLLISLAVALVTLATGFFLWLQATGIRFRL